MEKTEKILIIVSGGVVQSVYCSDPNFKVDLLDFDNEEYETAELADKVLENRKQELVNIF